MWQNQMSSLILHEGICHWIDTLVRGCVISEALPFHTLKKGPKIAYPRAMLIIKVAQFTKFIN